MGAHAGPAGYKNRPPHTHREKFYFPIERKNKILVKVRLHFFEARRSSRGIVPSSLRSSIFRYARDEYVMMERNITYIYIP